MMIADEEGVEARAPGRRRPLDHPARALALVRHRVAARERDAYAHEPSLPTRQLSQSTAEPRPTRTAVVPMVDRSDIHLIVVLLRPAKARPMTGSTGRHNPSRCILRW